MLQHRCCSLRGRSLGVSCDPNHHDRGGVLAWQHQFAKESRPSLAALLLPAVRIVSEPVDGLALSGSFELCRCACCPSRAPVRFEHERHSGLRFDRLLICSGRQPNNRALRLLMMWPATNWLGLEYMSVLPHTAHGRRIALRMARLRRYSGVSSNGSLGVLGPRHDMH